MIKVKVEGKDVEIPELLEDDIKLCDPIGTASGVNLQHCLYMGVKFGNGLLERVAGYKSHPPTPEEAKEGITVCVTFYARKKHGEEDGS